MTDDLPTVGVDLVEITTPETDHFILRPTARFTLSRLGVDETHDLVVEFDAELKTSLEDLRRSAFDGLLSVLEEWAMVASAKKIRYKEGVDDN